MTPGITPVSLTRVAALTAVAALALVACTSTPEPTAANEEASLTVSAGLYPLQFVAQEVGGDLVAVTSLAPPGVEPHDLELSPAKVRELPDSDMVLYIAGFQPAVDEALAATGAYGLDAGSVVTLRPAAPHDDEKEEGGDEYEDGAYDPHFWLDPALLADFGLALGQEFASLDPEHADTYRDNAAALAEQLHDLDETLSAGLSRCTRRDIVVTHEAFGYLAGAYVLNQEGIAGLDPEAEPSPARLREIKHVLADTGSTTVFTEALVSPKVAESLAADAGITTAVLDPLESVAEGDDYLKVMTRNLETLRTALDCA